MEYTNNKTRWTVKINDQKNKRVLVEYFPIESKFLFSGQFKIAEIWYTFSVREIILSSNYKDITINDIDDTLLKVYNELEDKIFIYNSFAEMMIEYKDIKIADENNTDTNTTTL